MDDLFFALLNYGLNFWLDGKLICTENVARCDGIYYDEINFCSDDQTVYKTLVSLRCDWAKLKTVLPSQRSSTVPQVRMRKIWSTQRAAYSQLAIHSKKMRLINLALFFSISFGKLEKKSSLKHSNSQRMNSKANGYHNMYNLPTNNIKITLSDKIKTVYCFEILHALASAGFEAENCSRLDSNSHGPHSDEQSQR